MLPVSDDQRILQALDDTYRDALTALEGVDPGRPISPDGGVTTVGDVIDHLIAWECEGLAALRAHVWGDQYTPEQMPEIAHHQEESRDANAENLYARWEAIREAMKITLAGLSPDRLLGLMHYPWGAAGSPANLVEQLIYHQYEHLEDIRREPH